MVIVTVNSSSEFIASYILTVSCGILALIHVLVKPYNNKILKFDSVILHLIIFIVALDDFDSPLVVPLLLH